LTHQNSGHNHIKFDEAIIQEHDKDRGTRERIDEPKTPYDDGSGEAGNFDEFAAAGDVEMSVDQ
jgi:hypothetical protein